MKQLHCPLNGLRNINEFICFGEVDMDSQELNNDEGQWLAHLWGQDTVMGRRLEWWCHTASSYWFIAERDTVTDEVIRTLTTKEFFGAKRDSIND